MQPCCLLLPSPQMVHDLSCFSMSPKPRGCLNHDSINKGKGMETVGNKGQCPWSAGLGIPQCGMGTTIPWLRKTWVIPVQYLTYVPWGKDWACGHWGTSGRSFLLWPAHAGNGGVFT